MNMIRDTIFFELDPRLRIDTHPLGDFPLSRVLLMNDARFPWLILVPRQPELRELSDLVLADQHTLLNEIKRVTDALQILCKPHKLNIAILGNVVEQLHVHVIARQPEDALWPRPVWGIGDAQPYANKERSICIAKWRAALGLPA